jgi:hypothetical protein
MYNGPVRLLLVLLLAAVPFAAHGKKKKPPSPATDFTTALDARSDAVTRCALPLVATPGTTVELTAKVTLNHRGQVLAVDVTIAPDSPAAASTRTCVEKALRDAPWPTSRAPLVTAARTWRLSS